MSLITSLYDERSGGTQERRRGCSPQKNSVWSPWESGILYDTSLYL